SPAATSPKPEVPPVGSKLELTDEQWKAKLTPDQYRVLRKESTERPFTNAFADEHRPGTYYCAGCGAPLFSAAAKCDSGTGSASRLLAFDQQERLAGLGTRVVLAQAGGPRDLHALGGRVGAEAEEEPGIRLREEPRASGLDLRQRPDGRPEPDHGAEGVAPGA